MMYNCYEYESFKQQIDEKMWQSIFGYVTLGCVLNRFSVNNKEFCTINPGNAQPNPGCNEITGADADTLCTYLQECRGAKCTPFRDIPACPPGFSSHDYEYDSSLIDHGILIDMLTDEQYQEIFGEPRDSSDSDSNDIEPLAGLGALELLVYSFPATPKYQLLIWTGSYSNRTFRILRLAEGIRLECHPIGRFTPPWWPRDWYYLHYHLFGLDHMGVIETALIGYIIKKFTDPQEGSYYPGTAPYNTYDPSHNAFY